MKHAYSLSGTHLKRLCSFVLALLLPALGFSQSLPGSGNTLTFNGFSTYVNCGTSNRTLTSQITVEAWIKSSSADYQWIVGKYLNSNFEEKGFHLYINSGQAYFNGRIGVGTYLSSGPSTTRVNDGRWHHIAGTTDGNSWRVYVDGVLENTTSYGYATADLTTTTTMSIGNYAAQSGQYFQGEIDEVRVWRTARSAADIQANMCRKFATAPIDLVAYYNFDQTSGSVATDKGSQPTNGALVSFSGTPWHLSGAALGDASTSLYASSWAAGSRVALATSTADSAVVSGLPAQARGVQLYTVNSAPSIAAGPSAAANYVGVFTAGTSANLPYTLRLRPAGGSSCRSIQQRPANDQSWTNLTITSTTATSLVANTPVYRGEYILLGALSAPITVAGDSAVCAGATGQLTATTVGATAYRWNTGATTAVLSGVGPGTYTVTVSFAGGCSGTGTGTIRQAKAPVPVISGDSVVCAGTPGRLTATASGPVAYRWNTGATTASIAVTQSGTYTVTATSGAGCTQTAAYRVRATMAVPPFSLGADTTLCDGDRLVLSGPSGVRYRYQWSDGSTNRQLAVSTAGTYTLRITNECGNVQAVRAITVRNCLNIPNVITPNNDARNDLFVVEGLRGDGWNLDIYNRWGRPVLHTDNYRNDWGQAVAPGLYYVLLRRAGTGYSYKGWVEVMP